MGYRTLNQKSTCKLFFFFSWLKWVVPMFRSKSSWNHFTSQSKKKLLKNAAVFHGAESDLLTYTTWSTPQIFTFLGRILIWSFCRLIHSEIKNLSLQSEIFFFKEKKKRSSDVIANNFMHFTPQKSSDHPHTIESGSALLTYWQKNCPTTFLLSFWTRSVLSWKLWLTFLSRELLFNFFF